jgi:enoyl-CoA hydratase/carnithine racemase
MDEAERDPAIQALVVTSTHKSVFCPGVDLPSMVDNSPEEMRSFFEALTGIVRRKFAYPKAEVYALNGHTIAGGCMMALAGDYRLMAKGRNYIGLMEIDIGLAAPIGIVAMIIHVLGGHVAELILSSGERYTPERALELNLVDEVVDKEVLIDRAIEHAELLGSKLPNGYQRLKQYLRQDVVEKMQRLDAEHLDDLVDQWFDEETQKHVAAAVQRMTKPR